jgi:hypothetical protein
MLAVPWWIPIADVGYIEYIAIPGSEVSREYGKLRIIIW